jgi:hypothetical protein
MPPLQKSGKTFWNNQREGGRGNAWEGRVIGIAVVDVGIERL